MVYNFVIMPELQDIKITAVNKRSFILVYKQPYPVTAKRVSLQCMELLCRRRVDTKLCPLIEQVAMYITCAP